MCAAQLMLSPGCVILCTPGDKSMVLSETSKTITGVSYSVGVVSCSRCVIRAKRDF